MVDTPEQTAHKLPQKMKKGRKPTRIQRAYNKRVAHKKVFVEHAFYRIKQYDRMTQPYKGAAEEFNAEMNIVTELVNLKIMFDEIRNGRTVFAWTLEKIRALG